MPPLSDKQQKTPKRPKQEPKYSPSDYDGSELIAEEV